MQKDTSQFKDKLNKLLIVIFVVFIFGFAVFQAVLPDRTFSEQENRSLKQLPKLSTGTGTISENIQNGKFLDRLLSGEFASDMNKYLSDQFPLRDTFVGIKAGIEIGLLKQQNGDVILGKNGYLFKREDYPSIENLESNIESIKYLFDCADKKQIQTLLATAGRNEDVSVNQLPDLYSTEHSEALWDKYRELTAGIEKVDLRDLLKEKSEGGEAVYYRTDHHWTSLGAYYAYLEISDALGGTPMDKEYFSIETATESFYGTTYSSGGIKWIPPEPIEFFRYEGDEEYTTVSGQRTISGFYDRSYLEIKDKYSAFLSGNEAAVTITKNGGEQRKKMMLIKDSFSHSLAPFLAIDYDLYLYDPRYSVEPVSQVIDRFEPDVILVITGISTLTDSEVMNILYS